jgi:hypothetical protein
VRNTLHAASRVKKWGHLRRFSTPLSASVVALEGEIELYRARQLDVEGALVEHDMTTSRQTVARGEACSWSAICMEAPERVRGFASGRF